MEALIAVLEALDSCSGSDLVTKILRVATKINKLSELEGAAELERLTEICTDAVDHESEALLAKQVQEMLDDLKASR